MSTAVDVQYSGGMISLRCTAQPLLYYTYVMRGELLFVFTVCIQKLQSAQITTRATSIIMIMGEFVQNMDDRAR